MTKNGQPPKSPMIHKDHFEAQVHPDWWRHIFTSLYLKTDGDVVNDPGITGKEVSLILDTLKVQPDAHVLDLCCGQGRHSLEIARRGFKNIDGLDRSHYLIQRAKSQGKKEALPVRFKEGDARKLPYPSDSFDVVTILGNSFGYFESVQDDMRVLKEVARVLKPWGKLLIDVTDGDYLREHFEPRSWEWMDEKHFVCRERSLSLDGQRLISRELINHTQKGLIADHFYAERLYSKESLTNLLKHAGFSDTMFHAEVSPESQRNQDLGMMQRRFILTTTIKKQWAAQKKKKEQTKEVVVIMGDPSKPDALKPLCIFDDDDFYTIDQLKNALRQIDRYKITYLNNHNTLIHDLARIKPKVDFVFNLCDEGFNNDPRKELHIPSLLEIMGFRYTGSGPQCLAYCYDKSLVRGIAKEMGIAVPEAFFIRPEETSFELPFNFPVIAKPNFGDSSFGITTRSVSYTIEELVNAISEIRSKIGYEKPILVEEFLTGKDLSLGIIGNAPESYMVLPIIEEDYSGLPESLPKICGYEAKWLPDSPYATVKSIPAQISEETKKLLEEWCVMLFERLECRDYCRFDWRLDANGNPKLLEVNPNPGWCWDGHLAKMSAFSEIDYPKMIETILAEAEKRFSRETEMVVEKPLAPAGVS
nr:methyltransferase domain-containing protein [Chloroherpeton thalassium]